VHGPTLGAESAVPEAPELQGHGYAAVVRGRILTGECFRTSAELHGIRAEASEPHGGRRRRYRILDNGAFSMAMQKVDGSQLRLLTEHLGDNLRPTLPRMTIRLRSLAPLLSVRLSRDLLQKLLLFPRHFKREKDARDGGECSEGVVNMPLPLELHFVGERGGLKYQHAAFEGVCRFSDSRKASQCISALGLSEADTPLARMEGDGFCSRENPREQGALTERFFFAFAVDVHALSFADVRRLSIRIVSPTGRVLGSDSFEGDELQTKAWFQPTDRTARHLEIEVVPTLTSGLRMEVEVISNGKRSPRELQIGASLRALAPSSLVSVSMSAPSIAISVHEEAPPTDTARSDMAAVICGRQVLLNAETGLPSLSLLQPVNGRGSPFQKGFSNVCVTGAWEIGALPRSLGNASPSRRASLRLQRGERPQAIGVPRLQAGPCD